MILTEDTTQNICVSVFKYFGGIKYYLYRQSTYLCQLKSLKQAAEYTVKYCCCQDSSQTFQCFQALSTVSAPLLLPRGSRHTIDWQANYSFVGCNYFNFLFISMALFPLRIVLSCFKGLSRDKLFLFHFNILKNVFMLLLLCSFAKDRLNVQKSLQILELQIQ